MKYWPHILSFLGIILFYFLGKTYKSRGLGDITSLFFYAGMIICFISLIVSFVMPSSFNAFKKIFLGLIIGIISMAIIVYAIILFEDTSSKKMGKERSLAIEKQSNQYTKIDVIKSFQIKAFIDSTTSPHKKAVIFQLETNQDSLVRNWNIQFFGFLKAEEHKLLLDLKVIESEIISLENFMEIPVFLTENTLQQDRLKSSDKNKEALEYIILLTNPNDKYDPLKFNEGIAYTSLSSEEVKLKGAMFTHMQSKTYHMYHHPKLQLNQKLYLKDFVSLNKKGN